MFCRCANGFGGGAEHADLPGLPRLPRRAAGAEPAGDRVDDQARARARLRDRRRGPSSRARTTSTPTCRRAIRSPSTICRLASNGKVLVPTAGRRPRDRDRPRAPRGGRGEDRRTSAAAPGRIGGADDSLVDFNRGGTPLVEIVTGPDIHSAEEARRFLQLLRQTIVELGISDAEMEKGTLRVDANVSVRPAGSDELRTRCELKNMNSFRFVARGIDAEVARQIALYESGGEVVQETYDFDASTGALTARRSKEEADDYRYFPEPDLVPVEPPAELVERLRAELPESPAARIRRIEAELDLDRAVVLVTGGLDRLWQATAAAGADAVAAANVIANRLARRRRRRRSTRPSSPSSSRRATGSRARRSTRRSARSREPGFAADAVPRAGGRLRHRRAGADRRPDPRGQPGPGGRVPGRQGGPARLLRRPGDEGDGRQGERPRGQRARAREAPEPA